MRRTRQCKNRKGTKAVPNIKSKKKLSRMFKKLKTRYYGRKKTT